MIPLAAGAKWATLNADAFDTLASLPDSAADHIITDPPYSPKTHNGARTAGDVSKAFVTFDAIDFDRLAHFFTEAVRVARRWVVATIDYAHAARLQEMGLPVVRVGVWVKPNGAPQFTGDRPGMGWEAVVILHRAGRKRWNGGGHHAVWIHNKENGFHPTQKPLALLDEWIAQFTDPNELVFDPFMGSGTTGVAALRAGRRFAGIERDKKWIECAKRRLADAADSCALLEHAALQQELLGLPA